MLSDMISNTIRANRFNDPERKRYFEHQKFDEKLASKAYLSLGMLSVPYLFFLSTLACSSSFGVDFIPTYFITRNCLRWISLHIAINGGVHYGLAEIRFEAGGYDSTIKKKRIEGETEYNFDPANHPIPYNIYLQFIYSFIPAICSYFVTKTLLFENCEILTEPVINAGFGTLILIQIGS